MSRLLRLENLSVGSRLKPISLEIGRGEFVGLIGPNGAGKTTLLRAALGLIPASGASSVTAMPIAQRPRHVAYLAQERQLVWPLTVADLVALGARANPQQAKTCDDIAHEVLADLQLSKFAMRLVNSLSGGEKARVLMARALAQGAPLLLADEPCAALDPSQAIAVARVLAGQTRQGRSVLASLHDLPIAARYCSRVLVMREGRVVADGPPEDVMSPALMAEVFGIGFERHQRASGPSWTVTELEDVR